VNQSFGVAYDPAAGKNVELDLCYGAACFLPRCADGHCIAVSPKYFQEKTKYERLSVAGAKDAGMINGIKEANQDFRVLNYSRITDTRRLGGAGGAGELLFPLRQRVGLPG
jgi:hypothetical protein